MGEYATRKSDNKRVKIGTCESMYYLRYEDRDKVRQEIGSITAATADNRFWRLPFPDEDNLQAGDYEDYNRGLRLCKQGKYGAVDYANPDLDNVGIIQFRHESGLLLNVPCHHGEKLPDVVEPMEVFWNGKAHSYELAFLKNTKEGVLPVIRCRHCGNMWRMAWADIWDFITPDMQLRLKQYNKLIAA